MRCCQGLRPQGCCSCCRCSSYFSALVAVDAVVAVDSVVAVSVVVAVGAVDQYARRGVCFNCHLAVSTGV